MRILDLTTGSLVISPSFMNYFRNVTDKTLSDLIEGIVQIADTEKIFMKCTFHNDNPHYLIIVVFKNSNHTNVDEMQAKMNNLFVRYKNYNFSWHMSNYWIGKLSNGNLYMELVNTAKYLIYTKHSSIPNKIFSKSSSLEVISKAERIYNEGVLKTKPLYQDAKSNYELGNYEYAAFLLHQAIEFTYRVLEEAMLNSINRTHRVRAHQGFLGKYFPELSNVFPTIESDDKHLLSLLEKGYLGYRYRKGYSIQKHEYDQLQIFSQRLQKTGEQSFKTLLNSLKQRIRESELILSLKYHHISLKPIERKKTMTEDLLKPILTNLTNLFNVESVYCFGTRTSDCKVESTFLAVDNSIQQKHYDLLVITSETYGQNPELQNKINDLLPTGIRITLLVYPKEAIIKALDNNNRFFYKIIESQAIVYYNLGSIPIEIHSSFDVEQDFKVTQEYWDIRNEKAVSFNAAAESVLFEDVDVCISLINQSLEQVLLGLIFVFMGYRPVQFSLNHLIDLCTNFDKEIHTLLPRNNKYDREQFKTLMNGFSDVRYRGTLSEWELGDIGYWQLRCTQTIVFIENLCTLKLESIKSDRTVK